MASAPPREPPSRKPSRPCPICSKAPVEAYAPFCSKRCADVDLHRWLGGVYAVPTEEAADGDIAPRGDDET